MDGNSFSANLSFACGTIQESICKPYSDIYTTCVYFRIPVRTFFHGLGEGTVAVAMSTDAQYISTISSGEQQVRLSEMSGRQTDRAT